MRARARPDTHRGDQLSNCQQLALFVADKHEPLLNGFGGGVPADRLARAHSDRGILVEHAWA